MKEKRAHEWEGNSNVWTRKQKGGGVVCAREMKRKKSGLPA